MNKKGQTEDIFGDLLPAVIVIIICLFVLGVANSQRADTLNSKIFASQSNILLKNDISVLLDSEKEGVSIREAIIALPSAENKEEFKVKYIDEPFADLFKRMNSAPEMGVGQGYAVKITYPDNYIIWTTNDNWAFVIDKFDFQGSIYRGNDKYEEKYESADIMINENTRLQVGVYWSRKT